MLFTSDAPQETLVGVEVGDWVKYTIAVSFETNVPDEEPPRELVEINKTEWVKNIVLAISEANITFQRMAHFKNGSESTSVEYVDMKSGESSTIGTLMFIPSNLAAGDVIHASLTEHYYINNTIVCTYLGASRETNFLNMTTIYYEGSSVWTMMSAMYYWDRDTGVLCERPGATLDYVDGTVRLIGVTEKIVDTNLWEYINMPPVARAGPDQTVLEGMNVSLDASASYDLDGTIVIYDWDFGDGNTSFETSPMVTHTYMRAGTYTVTLTVRDTAGNSDTDTLTVTVEEAASPPILGVVILIILLVVFLFLFGIRVRR